jgi:Fur family peroxide stress response transcriptional regulator
MSLQSSFHNHKMLELEQVCRTNGLPLTVQRRAIMGALAERRDHPTADQVFDTIRSRMPGVSRTTVYRVLETFVQHGIVHKINSPMARARFDADTVRHHHLRCTGCDAVSDLHDTTLDRLPLPSPGNGGFEIHDFTIDFTGRCSRCVEADED